MTALDRAFALVQINAVAVLVGQHLNFDMARLNNEFFNEHAVVAEAGRGLGPGAFQAVAAFGVVMGDTHALAAAARRCLEHHGIADLVRDLDRHIRVGHGFRMAGNDADVGLFGQLLGFDLVAHGVDRADRRADEGHALLGQGLGEFGVFRQEAVTGVHRIRAGLLDRFQNLVDDQIALRRRRRTDVNGFVGHFRMQGHLVGIGIDGNRLDAHLLRGFHDAAGDFAAVGYQDFFKHVGRPRLFSL